MMKFDIDRYLYLTEIHKSCKHKKKALADIRNYLDSCGYLMPKPKWIYNADNIKTWKYLDAGSLNMRTGELMQVLNPLFEYINL